MARPRLARFLVTFIVIIFHESVAETADYRACSIKVTLTRRIASVARCGLLLHTEQRGLPVCVSVGLFVTFVSPAKTVGPIEMPFGWVTRCVRWGPDPPRERSNFLSGGGVVPTCPANLKGL